MPAYVLFENLEITDPARLEDYKQRTAPVVRRYGGRYVVLGGPAERLEGTWQPAFPVMIEFPTRADARRWYDSDEYRELKALRQSAGRFGGVLIDGLP
jgi:uncharacterized protein (DUF1330 family)